ncbi:cocaine- and amphetamine-regulated transcript-like [Notothenia coriiceps]|uniref:Cocaine- and amphetamine-regulated transcript-like n=1 Tax=Notothenia coriiceps TaxID=8208 RepID=A0A6I9MVD1_9TELE|nr:PREDICTED: cocaine- and amphetamine-regulated transcript protein-like [Notothenia coriiceps]
MFLLQWPLGRGYASPYKSGGCPVVGGRSPVDRQRLSAPPPLICCLLPGPPPSSSGSTTDSSGMLRGMLFLGLLSVLCHGQASQEVSAEDLRADRPEPATDRDLIEALEALLGRMHDRSPSTEKRGTIALCGMGDRCAMKFGPRIGKLCDCGRGANCNSYLLKCI